MATPDQEAIDMFMKITGSSEAIARQKLMEHRGDIADALNAYFNEGGTNLPVSDDVEEQMIRAAMDASIQEFENHAAKQERALRLQRDSRARAPIIRPPKSSEVELGKITSSSGGLQAGSSVPKDEAEDAEEKPLIRNTSAPLSLGSTDLAKATCEEERGRGEESQKKLQVEKEMERQLGAKEAALPPEPSLDDENAVTLLVKMPNGSHHGRRFLKSDNLQSLFDFIDTCRVVKTAHYRLVRPHPRRVFSDEESALTLNEVGLTNKEEALFLELI